jgi:polar amino acid transport system substrate-binding protein
MVLATALVAAGAMTLTACGSSGSSSGGNNVGSEAPSGSSVAGFGASESSSGGHGPAALVPSSIKSKGRITIAMDATYPPDESIASDGHTIVGLDADFGKALAKELGLKAKLVNVTFNSIIPRLVDGTYDLGLSSFTETKKREKQVDFITYFKAGEGFFVKAGSSKKHVTLGSLCGTSVAVENGTTEQDDANAQNKKCKSAGKGAVKVLTFKDQNGVNLAVSSGRAQIGFADSQVAAYLVSKSHGQLQNSGTAFKVAPYGIALPKGSGLDKAVLAAVNALIGNGTYMKILKKWGETSGAIKKSGKNQATS